MSLPVVANIDILRTLAFGGVSGTYAPVGPPFLFACRLICFTNNTDGDMFFSDDGINDKLFIAANSFKLFDITSNRAAAGSVWVFPVGKQFLVKQSTVATKGAVYIEVIY
jgi:hypothetical protein